MQWKAGLVAVNVECVYLPIGSPDCLFVNALMTFGRGGGGVVVVGWC